MPRYIEIEQKKLKELTKQVQLFQDDIVCGIGTDFMQKIATAENKLLFDIVKGLATEPTADVVPRSEVEKAKQDVAREIFEEIYRLLARHTHTCIGYSEIIGSHYYEKQLGNSIDELEKKYIGE